MFRLLLFFRVNQAQNTLSGFHLHLTGKLLGRGLVRKTLLHPLLTVSILVLEVPGGVPPALVSRKNPVA
jgi:hypothetical protein